MRHASARTHGDSDHSRVLTRRGHAEAAQVAAQLVQAGVLPDLALVSSATRARQTWDAMAERCPPCAVQESEALYSASTESVIDALRLTPADAEVVMYVGHNPTVSQLAAVLLDESVADDGLSLIVGGMAPGVAAVFEVEPAWQDLAPGGGRLTWVAHPEGH